MAKISVIVPIYNSSRYLHKCLNSIVNQQLEDIEIILVDDNSTDNSLEIIKEYEKNDARIKVIHLDENKGVGYARNIGMKASSSKYIGFVDSDDYIAPNMYRKLFFGAERNNVEIARCDSVHLFHGIDYKKLYTKIERRPIEIIKPLKTPRYLIEENCSCWNKIYKHDFLESFTFLENIKYEDYPFSIKVLGSANRIYSTHRRMYYYRIRNGSLSNIEFKKLDTSILDIFKCNEEIKNYFLEQGLLTFYKDTFKELFTLHSIHHCYPILSIKMPPDKKKELISNYIRYIELEYGSLEECKIYQQRKEHTLRFGPKMKYIENYMLDPKYMQSINKEEVFENVKRLILENSGRK